MTALDDTASRSAEAAAPEIAVAGSATSPERTEIQTRLFGIADRSLLRDLKTILDTAAKYADVKTGESDTITETATALLVECMRAYVMQEVVQDKTRLELMAQKRVPGILQQAATEQAEHIKLMEAHLTPEVIAQVKSSLMTEGSALLHAQEAVFADIHRLSELMAKEAVQHARSRCA